MGKRIKPEATVVADRKQAEGAVAMIATLDRQILAVELEMQDVIDQVKQNAKAEIAPLVERRKDLASAIQGFATVNRDALFAQKKSIDFAVGSIGFRKCTKLTCLPKVSMAMVLEKLKDYGMTEAVKVKESVNKEAMREWSDEKLSTVGMRRNVADQFFIDIPQDELGED